MVKFFRFKSDPFLDYIYQNVSNLTKPVKTSDFCKFNINKLNNDNYCIIFGAIHNLALAYTQSKLTGKTVTPDTYLKNFDIDTIFTTLPIDFNFSYFKSNELFELVVNTNTY